VVQVDGDAVCIHVDNAHWLHVAGVDIGGAGGEVARIMTAGMDLDARPVVARQPEGSALYLVDVGG